MSKSLEERVADLERLVAELQGAQKPIAVGDRARQAFTVGDIVRVVSTRGALTRNLRLTELSGVGFVDLVDHGTCFVRASSWLAWVNFCDLELVQP